MPQSCAFSSAYFLLAARTAVLALRKCETLTYLWTLTHQRTIDTRATRLQPVDIQYSSAGVGVGYLPYSRECPCHCDKVYMHRVPKRLTKLICQNHFHHGPQQGPQDLFQ
jgi:hypothetical protein